MLARSSDIEFGGGVAEGEKYPVCIRTAVVTKRHLKKRVNQNADFSAAISSNSSWIRWLKQKMSTNVIQVHIEQGSSFLD